MFKISEENIQRLFNLGLTKGQAKVYLTLAMLGQAPARKISSHSEVARQEVYRLLTELQEKVLIERIVASPTQFKAIPIEEGLSILIKRKEEEISEIKKEKSKILENFKQNSTKPAMDEHAAQFVFTPKREAVILRVRKQFETVEKTFDLISASQPFAQSIFELSEEFSKALRKGVRIRVIIDSKEIESLTGTFQTFTKTGSFKLKTLNEKISITMGVCDTKAIVMSCFSEKRFAESPILWSNNPNLTKIVQNYFELTWKKAT